MVRLGCCSHELQIRYFNFSAIFLDWKILASWGSCRIHLLNYLAIISLHICISPSIHPSIYPPRHPPTYPPTLSPICLSPATSIHSPIHPLTHLSIIHDPSIHPSVHSFIHPSICPSLYSSTISLLPPLSITSTTSQDLHLPPRFINFRGVSHQ